jgi:short-chain fatty acids transporter
MSQTTDKATTKKRRGPLEAVTGFFTNLTRKYVPDPLVLAIFLSLLVAVLALTIERTNPVTILQAWGDGFWELLEFTCQMAFALFAGYILAKSPAVDRLITAVAARVSSPRTAIVIATLAGGLGSYLNWAFGLVVGGVVAKRLATQVRGVHYPVIIASAYSAFTIYGFGLSASIPLVISTKGHPFESAMGIVPLAQTIFSPHILLTAVVTLLALCIINPMLQPKNQERIVEIDRSLVDEELDLSSPLRIDTLADRMNHSMLPNLIIGLIGLGYVAIHFATGGTLDINMVNFMLLFLGLLLLRTPSNFVKVGADSVKNVSGILMQYPFYAGILAIMTVSGLVGTIGGWFESVASAETLPVVNLLSSAVINVFAPSAGGHWVIQGPFAIEAAHSLGSSVAHNAMAVMMGNALQDICQPLWILPALALSKLKLRDIMGYLVVIMFFVALIYIISMLLWGYFG